MSQYQKILQMLLSGQKDNNFDFDDLVKILLYCNFDFRQKGSHHIFTKPEYNILFNLQKDGKLAKSYQVKQVRKYLLKVLSEEEGFYEI